MRVCMITYSFYESDTRVRMYAEALARRGDEVEVLCLRPKGEASRPFSVEGVRVIPLQARRIDERTPAQFLLRIGAFFLRCLARVSWGHARRRYDAVHVHNMPDFLVFAAILPRLTGSTVILDIHDLLPELFLDKFGRPGGRPLLRRLLLLEERLSARFCHRVILSNHLWAPLVAERARLKAPPAVFLNYPDRGIFRDRGPEPEGADFVLIYPGSIHRHQGLDLLVEAVGLLKDESPPVKAWIYGEGSEKGRLEEMAGERALKDRVLFLGPATVREVAAAMGKASAGVIPKRGDGFGGRAFSTKSLEFMSVGIPVIISDTDIDRHYFPPSTVRFFRSGDPASLAGAIRAVRDDKGLRASLVANAKELLGGFDWDVLRADYFALVDAGRRG